MNRSRQALTLLVAATLATPVALGLAVPSSAAKPADQYSGPHFGDGNLPTGCRQDQSVRAQITGGQPAGSNVCHYMRTDLNALDSPQVDVLVMVPVSPTAERDMRIMRQSVEMWEGGIEYLSTEMGLQWLADGMDFHITVDYFDPQGGQGGEFTTYPVVDPEIVVIATNPAGNGGIGTDPFAKGSGVPCHPVGNPFDFQQWQALPGFDSHHEKRSGTYVEDCGGSGGNVCFAINTAIDPLPGELYTGIALFDLVSHEFGHCLTIGHVGDADDGKWAQAPKSDIMAVSNPPHGFDKCVSTLDVEAIAARMSNYLDVNGDRAVDPKDLLLVNDQIGERTHRFQAQHPDDHLYASASGLARHCPQPDLGLVPGKRTDWNPNP